MIQEDLITAMEHVVSQNIFRDHHEAMAHLRNVKATLFRDNHKKCWSLIFITKDGAEMMARYSSKEKAEKFVPECGEFYDPTWDRMIQVKVEEEDVANLSNKEVLLIDALYMDHYLKDIHCK